MGNLACVHMLHKCALLGAVPPNFGDVVQAVPNVLLPPLDKFSCLGVLDGLRTRGVVVPIKRIECSCIDSIMKICNL